MQLGLDRAAQNRRCLSHPPRVAGPARFHAVAQLGGSVEGLAERFRVFAAAQQRALRAKASAQRVKQLLFASVSHDLKSPLNAILGFAELVRDEPLSVAQAERLTMVSGRGRELFALIETILEAARVEAGQLKLEPRDLPAVELVRAALDKARDLHGGSVTEVVLELAPDMPPLRADPRRGPAALAVLIAHAMASASSAPGRAIRVSGTRPVAIAGDPAGAAARLYIEHVATGSRPSLLEMQLSGRSSSASERGMVLRLSLARAIIELHGGRVDVSRGPHGAAVVSCLWPAGGGEAPPEGDERGEARSGRA
jgi:signal transduction histidine kinase